MKENVDVVVMFCAPLSTHPEQPKDNSKCELIDCPKCNKKMWFSEKKRVLKKLAEQSGKEILLACFICFEKIAKDNTEMFDDHIRIDL